MIIYITTNMINGKMYIGKDVKNNPNYIGSGSVLKTAIKKYGRHNFKKVIIETCKTEDEVIHVGNTFVHPVFIAVDLETWDDFNLKDSGGDFQKVAGSLLGTKKPVKKVAKKPVKKVSKKK